MTRGTTPTLEFNIPFQTDTLEMVYITFNQNSRTVMEKDIESVTLKDKTITLVLSQEDTLSFSEGKNVEIQVALKTTDGEVFRSNIITTYVGRILKDGQI